MDLVVHKVDPGYKKDELSFEGLTRYKQEVLEKLGVLFNTLDEAQQLKEKLREMETYNQELRKEQSKLLSASQFMKSEQQEQQDRITMLKGALKAKKKEIDQLQRQIINSATPSDYSPYPATLHLDQTPIPQKTG